MKGVIVIQEIITDDSSSHPVAHSNSYLGHISLLGLQAQTRRQRNSSTFCSFKSYNPENFVPISYCRATKELLNAGADPENLHGRWLTRWLPILNYTSAEGVAG